MNINLQNKIREMYSKGIGKKSIGKSLGISEWQVRKILSKAEFKIEHKIKRLFFDIETSYNIVKSWQIGQNINLSMDNIIEERAIICLCYKWEGENTVHSITWEDGDDKKAVQQFLKIAEEADELVGHNIVDFDTKFILTRAIKHGILAIPKYVTYDTLKKARSYFNFNSNKLDYISKFLGFEGKKSHRGMALWDDVILNNDKEALKEMVEYCKQDVVETEKVYNKLKLYTEHNTHHGVLQGKANTSCPNCASEDLSFIKTQATKIGRLRKLMKCKSCQQKFFLSEREYNNLNKK